MSFDYITSLRIDAKKESITVTAYPNNVRPRSPFTSEYGEKEEPFRERLARFWVSVLEGNFQLRTRDKLTNDPAFSLKTLRDDVNRALDTGCGGDFQDFLMSDLKYRTEYLDRIYQKIAEEYCVPVSLHETPTISPKEAAFAYGRECASKWEKIHKELKAEGIVLIHSAAGYFTKFPELVLLSENEKDGRLILAHKPMYDNHGRLDNGCYTAPYLAKGTEKYWGVLTQALMKGQESEEWERAAAFCPEIRLVPALIRYWSEKDTRLREARRLWDTFTDVPMDPETERTEGPWHRFPAGTSREEIWQWFEDQFQVSVAEDLMDMEEEPV